MEYLKVKTKGNSSPRGKRRVYFTCHPADFDRYFDQICEDLFRYQDCAVYYAADMASALPDEAYALDLRQMNLFVIPVTLRLLLEEDRAMGVDFPFAAREHIPVLPILMEPGLDAVYSRVDRFGPLQYLDPNARDATAIGYGEKLKKYLQSVLVGDELAERVRAAFDAYIFLSYRKKDRALANELMRLIHADPRYRDIAIWYDEYLVPGENFNDTIERALRKGDLFTLLVTPNLVNEENYVQSTEYPAARREGKDVLPVEMAATGREALEALFPGVPACVPGRDEARLAEALGHLAREENDEDPTHNYLIGLAYLEGIDVEVDRARGLTLITGAAEAGLPEAMEKLADMYYNGTGVDLDYRLAAKWRERLAEYYMQNPGEEHPDTLIALNNLAVTYDNLGKHTKALELLEKVYALRCKVLGEEHPDTLTTLSNLAATYGKLGEHKKELELEEKVYILQCKVLGEEHPDTIMTLHNLAATYLNLGEYRKGLELEERVYALHCKALGEEHPDTLLALNNLAASYYKSGKHRKTMELMKKVYTHLCKVLGKEHPITLTTLGNLAYTYGELGECKKELELEEKVYTRQCKVLGEEHPDTLTTLSNLAATYGKLGEHRKALELEEKVYILQCKVLGKEHPDTITTLNNLAATYSGLGQHRRALELIKKVCTLQCRVLGKEHPDTITTLDTLASIYYYLGEYRKAQEWAETAYVLQRKVLGKNHPDTLAALKSLENIRKKIL